MINFIKRKIFKLFNGFDPKDTWSLDYSLCKWIVPRLEYMIKNTESYPTSLETDQELLQHFKNEVVLHPETPEDDYYHVWIYVLETIKHGFQSYITFCENVYTDEIVEKLTIKCFDKSMKLFNKYFFHLWT